MQQFEKRICEYLRTVEPKFLPEGVSPASIELQRVVDFIFQGMDFVVAIFDNLLVCADSEEQLYDRVEQIYLRYG